MTRVNVVMSWCHLVVLHTFTAVAGWTTTTDLIQTRMAVAAKGRRARRRRRTRTRRTRRRRKARMRRRGRRWRRSGTVPSHPKISCSQN